MSIENSLQRLRKNNFRAVLRKVALGICRFADMDNNTDRRAEHRLQYHWPIWFAEDFYGKLTQGQMVDLSSRSASFTCRADDTCPYLGQQITARFSVPRYGEDDSFDMANFTRSAHICRVDQLNDFLRRIAIQFGQPLPFKPGEQTENKAQPDSDLAQVRSGNTHSAAE